MYGEMSTVPLEQLTTMVDNVSYIILLFMALIVRDNDIMFCVCLQVMLPLIGNEWNHIQWPHVVSQDVLKHTGEPPSLDTIKSPYVTPGLGSKYTH